MSAAVPLAQLQRLRGTLNLCVDALTALRWSIAWTRLDRPTREAVENALAVALGNPKPDRSCATCESVTNYHRTSQCKQCKVHNPDSSQDWWSWNGR